MGWVCEDTGRFEPAPEEPPVLKPAANRPATEDSARLTRAELGNGLALAGVIFLRIAGLFMLVPILALYVDRIDGATPTLIGLAIGIYGLTQALFQMPMGALSDRFGRKPIILAGLALFTGGSVLAGLAGNIWGVVLGRALQGMGAISSAVLALAADLTRETQRTKINAIIGITFGLSFVVGMVLGPWLNALVALRGVFFAAAGGGVLAMLLLVTLVKTPASRTAINKTPLSFAQITRLLKSPGLLHLNFGVFALHFLITAAFVLIPLKLVADTEVAAEAHVWIYLAAMGLSLLILIPLLAASGRKAPGGRVDPRFVFGIAVMCLSFAWPFTSNTDAVIRIGLFFVAFNYLEAVLPALVSVAAPAAEKGAALGVYASCQFTGAFLGGVSAGLALDFGGRAVVAVLCTVMAVLWLVVGRLSAPSQAATADPA